MGQVGAASDALVAAATTAGELSSLMAWIAAAPEAAGLCLCFPQVRLTSKAGRNKYVHVCRITS